jgi:hypothetical protein
MSQTSDKEKFRLLSEEVQSLLLKSVIEEIPGTNVFLLLSLPVGAEEETEADLLPLVNCTLTLRG